MKDYAKKEAIRLIENMKDNCSWDDIIYTVTIRAKIEEAMKNADCKYENDNHEASRKVKLI